MSSSVIKLEPEQVLFVEGELTTDFFILKSGEIRILKESKNRLTVLRLFKKGDFIGEVSAFSNEKLRGATAIAISPCELVKIPNKDILTALKACPPWVSATMKELVFKLQESGKIIRDQLIHKDEVTRNIEILTPVLEGKYLNSIEDYRRAKGIFVQK